MNETSDETHFSLFDYGQFMRVVQGLPRTNNSVEAWYLAFQQTVGLYHPTIYKLVEAMQLETSHTETMIGQGRDVHKKYARYERIDRAYRTIVDRYRRIETMDYLGISLVTSH